MGNTCATKQAVKDINQTNQNIKKKSLKNKASLTTQITTSILRKQVSIDRQSYILKQQSFLRNQQQIQEKENNAVEGQNIQRDTQLLRPSLGIKKSNLRVQNTNQRDKQLLTPSLGIKDKNSYSSLSQHQIQPIDNPQILKFLQIKRALPPSISKVGVRNSEYPKQKTQNILIKSQVTHKQQTTQISQITRINTQKIIQQNDQLQIKCSLPFLIKIFNI